MLKWRPLSFDGRDRTHGAMPRFVRIRVSRNRDKWQQYVKRGASQDMAPPMLLAASLTVCHAVRGAAGLWLTSLILLQLAKSSDLKLNSFMQSNNVPEKLSTCAGCKSFRLTLAAMSFVSTHISILLPQSEQHVHTNRQSFIGFVPNFCWL